MLGSELRDWSSAFSGIPRFGRWTRSNPEVQFVELADYPGIDFSLGFQGYADLDSRFVIGGKLPPHLASAPQICEYDPRTGAKLFQTAFGDLTTRGSTAVQLGVGNAIAGVACNDPSPMNEVQLEAFYRPPRLLLSLPGQPLLEPRWWFQRFTFPTTFGTSALRMELSSVLETAKRFAVYITRDSAGTIGRAQFEIEGPGLKLLGFNERFIDTNLGDVSPSGEYLLITAVQDGNRTLLAYQNQPHATVQSPTGTKITSRWAITEVLEDGSFHLLGVTPWWSLHSGEYPRPIIMPRPDGIYFALHYVDDAYSQGWKVGVFKDRNFQVMSELPNGRIRSYSADGWLLKEDRATREVDLIRLRPPPELTLSMMSGFAFVRWDKAAPTDVLEASSDLKTWTPIATGLPPVKVPGDKPAQFFRVQIF